MSSFLSTTFRTGAQPTFLPTVQGLYTFYLEQRGPTQFKGFLISPQGTRHAVEFNLSNIEDIKQVFDRIVLGRQDFV
jgi:hypothetical protein